MIDSVAATADHDADAAMPDSPEPDDRAARSARWALWAFAAYVAAGLPLLVLVIGKFWWFFRDDWFFITDRDVSFDGLVDDHNGHWSTTPVLAFRLLWAVFGLHSYAPYKAVVVALHLLVVVCIRIIMRRYGVGPWLATITAASLVLFGSGREDILWAFQIGFTGSIAFLLAQWVLTDREGAPIGRRDVLGVACGLLGASSSSPALPLLAALTATLWVRRGWKAALVNAAPVGGGYFLWGLIADPNRTSPYGGPPVGELVDWLHNGIVTAFDDLTGHRWATIALGLVVVTGTALSLVRPTRSSPLAGGAGALAGSASRLVRSVEVVRGRLRPVIGPVALFGATVTFILLAAQRAWIFGPEAASASRYIYAYVAFMLPLIAMSIQEVAARWRPAALLVLLVVVGVPSNLDRFEDPIFGPAHHAHQRDLFTNVVRAPGFDRAPDDLRPDPDPYNSPGLTVGFFRRAEADGKLPEVTSPVPDTILAELTVRLGMRQEVADGWLREPCTYTDGDGFQPEVGTSFYMDAPVDVRVRDHQGPQYPTRLDTGNGALVTVVAPDLDLDLTTVGGGTASICVVR